MSLSALCRDPPWELIWDPHTRLAAIGISHTIFISRKREPCGLPCPAVPLPKAWGCWALPRLVHIYIPHNRTPCGRGHWVGRSPLLLVGLTDSRGSHPQPFGVLDSAIPSLALGDYIIPQTRRFVKYFFQKFLRFFDGFFRRSYRHVCASPQTEPPPRLCLPIPRI